MFMTPRAALPHFTKRTILTYLERERVMPKGVVFYMDFDRTLSVFENICKKKKLCL